MGQVRDARIREFQKRAGLQPAMGERHDVLQSMKKEAVKLIEIVVLEQSGIRDGDGCWSGSDPLGATMRELTDLYRDWQEAGPGNPAEKKEN